jgi:hypothetical protein
MGAMLTLHMQNCNLMRSENSQRMLTIRDIWTRAISSNKRMTILSEFRIFLPQYTRVLLHIILDNTCQTERPVLPTV